MAKVTLSPTDTGLAEAIRSVFSACGGGRSMLKSSGEVYLKVNAIDFKPRCYVPPDFVVAVIRYFYDQGASRVFVIEDCTQGNFTRLVFRVTGLDRAIRSAGGIPICLDEDEAVGFRFTGKPSSGIEAGGYDRADFDMARTVAEHLVEGISKATYVNVAKLKTHSMTTVTLGIKNQWGFVAQADRIADHNFNLHSKLVDVLEYVRPDFTLVDAREALDRGHYPATSMLDALALPVGLVIGGDDVVAVDAVSASILGFDPFEIEHIRLACERGFGEARLDAIEINGDASPLAHTFSSILPDHFPPDVRVVQGAERCCREGCYSNPMAILHIFYTDYNGHGGFTLVIGKGHDPGVIGSIEGDVLVAGKCAGEEVSEELIDRLGAGHVRLSHGCNNLMETASGFFKLMKINPLKIVPINPFTSFGCLHRSRARIPPIIIR